MPEPPVAGARRASHGRAVPRGLQASAARPGRFAKMFDLPACRVGPGDIDELFELLGRRNDDTVDNGVIPAGFTYFGQFVDHDITFDQTPVEERVRDPEALVNFRTPRLDLDSLYAGGPAAAPDLYDRDADPPGVSLRIGHNPSGDLFEPDDLPRDDEEVALIGDPRNDENLIIAQLHLVFIRFHNAVVDELKRRREVKADDIFEEARRLVRWHYQWIVMHEFLRHVVGPDTAKAVLAAGVGGAPATIQREHFSWDDEPFIPLEFSGAAFRFGHSMVRKEYRLNTNMKARPIFKHARHPEDLAGLRRLPNGLKIEWSRFFALSSSTDAQHPRPGRRIDTRIEETLFHLPDGGGALPLRNLRRGQKLGLPSGQDVAVKMELPVLREAELHLDSRVSPEARAALSRATPLWYYILAEAQTTRKLIPEWKSPSAGRHLGPVGGRIVAEVLAGLLEGDPTSYFRHDPAWLPNVLLPARDDFTMADLIRFAGADDER